MGLQVASSSFTGNSGTSGGAVYMAGYGLAQCTDQQGNPANYNPRFLSQVTTFLVSDLH